MNWRTTSWGVGLIVYGVGLLAGIAVGEVAPDKAMVAFAAIGSGFGLIFARDAVPKG